MTSNYVVKFKNSMGNLRRIGQLRADSEDDAVFKAMEKIKTFCDDRSYRIPYTRYWKQGDTIIFDVGSHTEFFHLLPTEKDR